MLNAFVRLYMIGALGDLNKGKYEKGVDKTFTMSMFLMATFTIQIIFLNMLIAIMGETFAWVSESAVENGYKEQVALIVDHAFLVNICEVFDGQRHVVRVSIQNEGALDTEELISRVKELESNLNSRVSRINNRINKRIESADINQQHIIRNSYCLIDQVQDKIKHMEKRFAASMEHDECGQKLSKREIKMRKLLNKKKKDLIKDMNVLMRAERKSFNDVKGIALEWMAIADTDNSGVLDKKEFLAFFS